MLKDRTDKYEMLKKVIDAMQGLLEPAHGSEWNLAFKLMIDRETASRLYELDPPTFVEGKDWMEFRRVRMIRNDYVDGIWVELQ